MFHYIDNYLDGLGAKRCLSYMLAVSLLLGFIDFLIGPELSFSVFYTIPIMLATWYGGKLAGLTVTFVSTGVWLAADLSAGSQYSTFFIPVWNTTVRLAFFLIILWLLVVVREKLTLEESMADTDPLTGLANRRFFLEQLEREYVRVSRYPESITIAYFDLDNFKYVNDSWGHDVGDELLKIVAQTLSANTRSSDYSARLGGDEFAIMFPGIDTKLALPVLKNLQGELLASMHDNEWPVTFSIGAVTFSEVMDSSRDMVKRVDDVMYEVKKSGKNNIIQVEWPG